MAVHIFVCACISQSEHQVMTLKVSEKEGIEGKNAAVKAISLLNAWPGTGSWRETLSQY